MKKRKNNGRQIASASQFDSCRTVRGSVRIREKRWVALSFGVSLLFATLAIAKQKPPATKTISGQVLNASNQGIAGASVLLTDLETHKTNAIYSGSGGNYIFSGLNAYHDYEVRARYQGMSSKTREVSSMDPRLQVVVNLTVTPQS
jgi:hypothetical protein